MLRNKFWVLTAAFLSLTACKENTSSNAPVQIPSVGAIRLVPQDVPLSFEFAARAQGSKETEVRARVGGILLKRNYVEGSRVQEGDVLFEIDPDQYKVALDRAVANMAQVEANLKNAQTDWERKEKLAKDKIVSEKALDEARAALDSYKAAYLQAKAEVDAAQLNLNYTKVTAPISGITSMETQSEGSLITANGELTTITQLNPIYVIFSASENEMMSLANMVDNGLIKNPRNENEIYAKIRFSNGSVYSKEGQINFINPSIDETTGTIKLRAVFDNAEQKLRPGQFVRLVMEGFTRINALLIPQEAVMQSGSGSYVYRIGNDGTIENVQIRTGLTAPNGSWIVDEGLNAGDVIVTEGLMKLRAGMTVEPKFASTANAQ
ncbi:MAG: efflux RND transporter periplasmic adaptor subunit [Alphaproteobacteria bacterium]|nr:efflux RND transporter periplasmic adaptor subunit [Alphaproteobacteria bacterium]